MSGRSGNFVSGQPVRIKPVSGLRRLLARSDIRRFAGQEGHVVDSMNVTVDCDGPLYTVKFHDQRSLYVTYRMGSFTAKEMEPLNQTDLESGTIDDIIDRVALAPAMFGGKSKKGRVNRDVKV